MKHFLTAALVTLMIFSFQTPHEFDREGVRVKFPAAYKTDSVSEQSPYGTVTRLGVVAETSKCDYSLFINTYPASLVQQIGPTQLLTNAVTTTVQRMEGTLGKTENGSSEGAPSIQFKFTIEGQKRNGEGIALISGNRVIMLGVLYTVRPRNAQDFFKSLKLKKEVGHG
jgi:hypothetical protein